MAEAAEQESKTTEEEVSRETENTLTTEAAEKINEEAVSEEPQETISHKEETKDEEVFGKKEEELEFKKPEYLAEKFWDDKDGPRVEQMSKSISELEKKLSQGKHKQPDEYNIGVLDEHSIDKEDPIVQDFLKVAGESGLNQNSVDKILNTFLASNAQFLEKSKADVDTERKKLGGKADDIIEDAVRFQDSLLKKGVISEGQSQEYLKLCNTAEGIKLIRNIRNYYGEGTIPTIPANDEMGMSEEEVKAQVHDPKYQTDPSFRAKVEKDFNRMFKGVHKGGE
jgi:flagellar biosynthesis GTPase FlhF